MIQWSHKGRNKRENGDKDATLLLVYCPPGQGNWAGVAFAVEFFFALALGIYLALSLLRSDWD